MELLYVFNESVSANFCSAFEQSFQIIISGASTRWHHWSLERFRLWFLLISFFQQVSLCFRSFRCWNIHFLTYFTQLIVAYFFSFCIQIDFVHFLTPSSICKLLYSGYFQGRSYWCRDIFSRCFIVKPFWCLRNVHYYMINLMTSHLMMVYMWWVNNMGL